MGGEDIHVLARIYLLSAGEGGRTTPILGRTSYRPNHNFFGPTNRDMAVAFIELHQDQILNPGDTVDLNMTFLRWPWQRSELHPGREWLIQEGGTVVGVGIVLNVVD